MYYYSSLSGKRECITDTFMLPIGSVDLILICQTLFGERPNAWTNPGDYRFANAWVLWICVLYVSDRHQPRVWPEFFFLKLFYCLYFHLNMELNAHVACGSHKGEHLAPISRIWLHFSELPCPPVLYTVCGTNLLPGSLLGHPYFLDISALEKKIYLKKLSWTAKCRLTFRPAVLMVYPGSLTCDFENIRLIIVTYILIDNLYQPWKLLYICISMHMYTA